MRNRDGKLIQLSAIVNRSEGAAPNAIEHYNRLRSATISASLNGVPLGTAINRVEEMLKAELPPGFSYEWAGESRDFKDAGTEFLWVLMLALIIVYMVLAAQFESLLHPFTVLLAVPLAGLGAAGLLWLVNVLGASGIIPPVPAMNINLFSLIGLVLLVGLVTKNSILLVEFANQQREQGVNAARRDGASRHRSAAAHSDDGVLDHRGHSADRDWLRRGRGEPPSDGRGRGRRNADEHVPHAADHSGGLHAVERLRGVVAQIGPSRTSACEPADHAG